VQQLGLQPHPEGGWYAEVFRSARHVTAAPGPAHPSSAASPPLRAALTSIYFLLPEGTVSRWHVVQSDELWCHLEGAPLALYQFDADNERVSEQQLGPVAAEEVDAGHPGGGGLSSVIPNDIAAATRMLSYFRRCRHWMAK
jgi:predicted cupin superfamily sugar epimerase